MVHLYLKLFHYYRRMKTDSNMDKLGLLFKVKGLRCR